MNVCLFFTLSKKQLDREQLRFQTRSEYLSDLGKIKSEKPCSHGFFSRCQIKKNRVGNKKGGKLRNIVWLRKILLETATAGCFKRMIFLMFYVSYSIHNMDVI